MKKFLILLIFTLFLVGCLPQKDTFTANTVWVKIDPVQCLSNDWERDWLSKNPSQIYPSYQEEKIIKEYYLGKGIKASDYKKEKFSDVVCLSCSCPTGYTIYLEVPKGDLTKMIDLGFQEK